MGPYTIIMITIPHTQIMLAKILVVITGIRSHINICAISWCCVSRPVVLSGSGRNSGSGGVVYLP
jgi:hypothetical protein